MSPLCAACALGVAGIPYKSVNNMAGGIGSMAKGGFTSNFDLAATFI
jgi:hypothetical protein